MRITDKVIILLLVVVIISVFLSSAIPLWMMKEHRACFNGKKLEPRKGWRFKCVSNMAKNISIEKKLPLYIVSSISNSVSNRRANVTFGPPSPDGHPGYIQYTTLIGKEAMSVAYSDDRYIYVEATDFGVQNFIKIQTPNAPSAYCYNLVNNSSPVIRLKRDLGCVATLKEEGYELN